MPTEREVKVRRHEVLGLTDADVRAMYRSMLLARRLDERSWLLNRQGRVPFVVSCQGHEGAQVGAAWALERGRDWVVPYYRDFALVIALGMTPRDLMLSLFAKAGDPSSGGRQMPGHFSCRRLRIVTGSSCVGTQLPHAAGIALASWIRGEPEVTLVCFGEGATSEGDFHEALNFAAIHRLPVVFLCENNRYAISVPQARQMPVERVADRAAAYAIPGVVADGADPLDVYQAVREAVRRARAGEGPTLIEARVERLVPHTSDDDDRTYRPPGEIEAVRARDPLTCFARYLEEAGLLPADEQRRLDEELAAVVDDAVAYAESAPYPQPEVLFDHLYFTPGR